MLLATTAPISYLFLMVSPVPNHQKHVTSTTFSCPSCPSSFWSRTPAWSCKSALPDRSKFCRTECWQAAELLYHALLRLSGAFESTFLAKNSSKSSQISAARSAREGSVFVGRYSLQDPGSCSSVECSILSLPSLFVHPTLPLTLVSDGSLPHSFGS